MKSIVFSDDKYKMNWLRADFTYGEIITDTALTFALENRSEGERIYSTLTITNNTDKPIFTNRGNIGIRFPFNDKYEGSDVCITSRCNTHIFCGKDVTYIMALRMGGEAPHLGMFVTLGSFDSYSVQRDMSWTSNDRGCFILHPSSMELLPKETAQISWVIFPHGGKSDFYAKLFGFLRYIEVRADRYVLFEDEDVTLTVKSAFAAKAVKINGEIVANGTKTYTFKDCGEKVFEIEADGVKTLCRVFVQKKLDTLSALRCRFIAQKQQYEGRCANLKGAYLTYDNEEEHIYYDCLNDYNGARERVCMGLLIAKELQRRDDGALRESLWKYLDYVHREIYFDTGEISNEMGHDNGYKRLYNASWFATFFIECYRLNGDKTLLCEAQRVVKYFYDNGGMHFYPIDMPVLMLCDTLCEAGMTDAAQDVRALFVAHGDNMLKTGLHYPTSEVNYEQSIVAPAADILLKVYLLTKDEKYLTGAKKQIAVLEQFASNAPDYHLNETAIRHWDGFWFGKRKLYGDTFPHYWSALSGNVYALYAKITHDASYLKKAEDSLRGVLPLYFADGRASCAYVYPDSVNGVRAALYDDYANDQDWGLYFNLRFYDEF